MRLGSGRDVARHLPTRLIHNLIDTIRHPGGGHLPDWQYQRLVVLGRYFGHAVVVAIIGTSLWLATAARPDRAQEAPRVVGDGANTSARARSPIIISARSGAIGGTVEVRAPGGDPPASMSPDLIARQFVASQSQTALLPSRSGFISYTVQSGDSVEAVARAFGLSPASVLFSNKEVEEEPDRLVIGQVLQIPPQDGARYIVQPNDTLSGIAESHGVSADAITNYAPNKLSSGANLLPGAALFVPNGARRIEPRVVLHSETLLTARVPAPAPAPAPVALTVPSGTGFAWPTTGFISQGFWAGHRAIDIASGTGIPIAASQSGYVTYAGWDNTGYGWVITIDHGNGFSTLYAHNSQLYVATGQAVSRGQVIAAMGSSGRSTGPHVNFEIRYNGAPVNPLIYLP